MSGGTRHNTTSQLINHQKLNEGIMDKSQMPCMLCCMCDEADDMEIEMTIMNNNNKYVVKQTKNESIDEMEILRSDTTTL